MSCLGQCVGGGACVYMPLGALALMGVLGSNGVRLDGSSGQQRWALPPRYISIISTGRTLQAIKTYILNLMVISLPSLYMRGCPAEDVKTCPVLVLTVACRIPFAMLAPRSVYALAAELT